MHFSFWPFEPWRLFTSALPHVNVAHLAFNLYWLWVFGTFVESQWGSLKTAAVYLLFASISGAAEFAFLRGGVGLSGVGYGLFAMCFVLQRRDARFADAMDSQTVRLFVAWFFICIATTALKIMPVGNVAHGAGALVGVLVGLIATSSGTARRAWAAALSFGSVLLVFLAAGGREYVNLTDDPGYQFAYLGHQALEKQDNESAVRLLRKSLAFNDKIADTWKRLGIAYHRLRQADPALDAYQHAFALNPQDATLRGPIAAFKTYKAWSLRGHGSMSDVEKLLRESLELDNANAETWYYLAWCYKEQAKIPEAIQAAQTAVQRRPDPKYSELLDALKRIPTQEQSGAGSQRSQP
jgi:membrane associated rhomboid family serine protease